MNQEIETKKCSNPNCSQPIKPLSEFHFRKDTNKYRNECKCCVNKRSKCWRNNNPEQNKEIKHNWYLDNKDHVLQETKIWRLNNSKRYKETNRIYYSKHDEIIKLRSRNFSRNERIHINNWRRNKEINDPIFLIKRRIRGRIRSGLKNNIKYGHTLEILGSTFEENKQYIEHQFYNNIVWKLQGKGHGHWQIHHTCPLEYIDWNDPTEVKYAFHYTNTQPLWYDDHCEMHRKINERMSQYENSGKPVKIY